MANWNYLKFNKHSGDPSKKNVTPEPDSFVWGGDLRDYKVKICYQDRIGYSLVILQHRGMGTDQGRKDGTRPCRNQKVRHLLATNR
ncbi:MAG TPA: hypothetical protein PK620_01930 [Denitromonas sp.]|nr:hypothetical protein [Denitromonas sp.]